MTSLNAVDIRQAVPSDHPAVIRAMPDWWGGRDLTASVPKLFFMLFAPTCFIAEKDRKLTGFLVGFLSQTDPREGYIHFAGVHPDARHIGLGRALYEKFYQVCRDNGRTAVRACTSPVNKLSVAFHRAMGFSLEPGDATIDGLPVTTDFLKENDPKVVFKKQLT